jgi:hypothetical protein
MSIKVRELVNMTFDDIKMNIDKHVSVQFEDGVTVDTRRKSILYSWFFWEFHRRYDIPVLHTHFVDTILNGKSLSNSTHIKLLETIFADLMDTGLYETPELKEPILALIYEITNQVYNQLSRESEPYVSSINILDFLQVIDHPIIKKVVDEAQPNNESISNVYKTTISTINTDHTLANNPLVKAIRAELVSVNQVLQCVSVRGFVAEVDGSILSKPVMSNYSKGMGELYDYVADSRSAARSLYFSEAPLEDAEYFARRLQLLSMVVERIHYVDCGSTRYVNWFVRPPSDDDSGQYKGDLAFMDGKYYLDETSNSLKVITHKDTHLNGKIIKLRSPIFCTHPDAHGVCEVCFGRLAKNVSRYANLGHLCAATMTQQTSQSVLSTKHLLVSSVSANITLTDESRRFLSVTDTKNGYLVREELRDLSVKLVVNRDEETGLIDILEIDDVANINPSRVSYIEYIELQFIDKVTTEERAVLLQVNQANRRAVLTTEFLLYLKKYGWEIDSKNNFMFDLKDWDFSLPVLKLPDMEYSYSDHGHQIAKVIESRMADISERATPNSPVATLQEVFNLVNSKLNVNLAALEVIVYSMMIAGIDDYSLARNKPNPVLGVASMVIKNRSLGAVYTFQGQTPTILSPRSFFPEGRCDIVLDAFVKPREVVDNYR